MRTVLPVFVSFALAFLPGAPLAQPAPEPDTPRVEKAQVEARRFMVVAANPLAARAGLEMLRRGGSATDAAIATELVLGLVEPQSSGLGGGAFLLHYDAKRRRLDAYDGRETAPASAKPGRFLRADGRPLAWPEAIASGRSAGVPGLVRMLELAHREHGKLPWGSLFAPAIALARDGFAVSPRLHALVAADRFLRLDENARAYFYLPEGSAKPVGSVLKNPDMARVLERVAAEGADTFYRGEIARDIVAAVNREPGGGMTLDDVAGYRALRREPLCGGYRRFRICGMPPPSSGGFTVLQMLKLLERFDLRSLEAGSLEVVHLFSEAGRLAYADRDRYLADPGFVSAPIAALLERRYVESRSRLIDPKHSLGRAQAGDPAHLVEAFGRAPSLELPSTTHLSIVDAQGNAVALTASIESAFGNRRMVRGFMLNNELTDFAWLPEENGRPVANRVEGGKRPRSSMAPTLVFDEQQRLHMVIGSPGGHSIIHYVAQALVDVLDRGMGIQEAVSRPHAGSRNGPTDLERGTALEALAPALRRLGHEVRIRAETSGLHGIVRTKDGWAGGADPRREGVAVGE